MILSMTGYGRSEQINSDYSMLIEVRSLNSKYFDCQIKIPREISAMEIELRKIIEQRLEPRTHADEKVPDASKESGDFVASDAERVRDILCEE